MDGKDAAVIVDADDRVEVAAGDEPLAQPRAAMIGGQAGRQHKADPPTLARERDRALQKQLISVRVASRLSAVDTGVACEPQY